jgi:hypothetical protein
MNETPSGCAVGSDGKLLDASEIDFYNSAEDEDPLSRLPAVQNSGKTSAPTHPFFGGKVAPHGKVAGTRCSTRSTRPSARLRDPENAEGTATAGQKRIRPNNPTTRRVSQKVAMSEDDEGHSLVPTEAAMSEPEDGEAAEWAKLQAQANADRKVQILSS